MKKVLMMMAFAAMFAFDTVAHAQSLEGDWQAEKKMEDVAMNYILAFMGNEVTQSLVCTCEKEIGTVSVSFVLPAQSYTPGAKTINFTFDASMVEVKLKDVIFNKATKDVIKERPSSEKYIMDLVLDDFKEQKEDVAIQFLFSGDCTIANQTVQSFELKNAKGETYLFKKTK